MKILFVTPKFQPEIGGVEKHTYCVARELANYGNNMEIVTSTQRIDLKLDQRENKMHVYRLLLANKGNNRLNIVVSLARMWFYLLKKFRLFVGNDIIHLHDYQTFLWVFPFISLLRKPIFITFHGFEDYPIPASARIIRKIAEKTVNGSICVGAFISKWYGTQPKYTTIGGVEILQELVPGSPLEDEIVFIGRLAKDTGILDLIDALRILRETHGVEIPLHICGDGHLRSQIAEYAKNNDLRIFMHGFVTYPQLYLLKCRYAFVTGYLSILEAMSCKRPVFAIYNNPLKRDYLYSIPNARELMFITSSSKDLAERLYFATKNYEQTALLSERAYQFAKQQTWHQVAGMYLELYQKRGD